MTLCFGVFAKILNHCRQNITQAKFVSRIAWVVDRKNSTLASGLDYVVEDPEGMEGNGPVVTKLLSCKQSLVLRESELPPLAEVARVRFKSKVIPFISIDKVEQAILAVLYVIHEDKTIDSDHRECFKTCLGMYKDELLKGAELDVSDFLAKVLLYTTHIENNSEVARYSAVEIKSNYSKRAKENCGFKVEFDAVSQKIMIKPAEGCAQHELNFQVKLKPFGKIPKFTFEQTQQILRTRLELNNEDDKKL